MVDKNNREELPKTSIYEYELLDDNHVIFIDAVSQNFIKTEKTLGDLRDDELNEIKNDGSYSVAIYIKNLLNKVKNIKIPNVEQIDTKVTCTEWEMLKLSEVLKKIKEKFKSFEDKDKELEETDAALIKKDTEIINTIRAYKSAVDEYNSWLGTTVEAHASANEKLRILLKGR